MGSDCLRYKSAKNGVPDPWAKSYRPIFSTLFVIWVYRQTHENSHKTPNVDLISWNTQLRSQFMPTYPQPLRNFFPKNLWNILSQKLKLVFEPNTDFWIKYWTISSQKQITIFKLYFDSWTKQWTISSQSLIMVSEPNTDDNLRNRQCILWGCFQWSQKTAKLSQPLRKLLLDQY